VSAPEQIFPHNASLYNVLCRFGREPAVPRLQKRANSALGRSTPSSRKLLSPCFEAEEGKTNHPPQQGSKQARSNATRPTAAGQ
jgi:hypothetical protein